MSSPFSLSSDLEGLVRRALVNEAVTCYD